MRFFTQPVVISLTALMLFACGGSSKPAEDATEAKPESSAEPAQSEAAKPEKAQADKKDEPSADTGMPKVVRTAKDRLTATDIVFKFNFKESDVGLKAEESCTASSKGDGAKKSKCFTAAQKRITIDDWVFKKGDNDAWYLLGMRTVGSKVTWTHRMPIEFGQDSETSAVVKITGADKGQAPFRNPPSEITFETPNEYQIIQKSAEHGKLVFEAKINTLGDNASKPAR